MVGVVERGGVNVKEHLKAMSIFVAGVVLVVSSSPLIFTALIMGFLITLYRLLKAALMTMTTYKPFANAVTKRKRKPNHSTLAFSGSLISSEEWEENVLKAVKNERIRLKK
jgi:hypothetical protein